MSFDYDQALYNAITTNNGALVNQILSDYEKEIGFWDDHTHDPEYDINTPNLANHFLNEQSYPIPPLVLAIRLNALLAADVLINHGADINNDDGYVTPLQAAAQNNNLEAMQWLLQLGADPDEVTDQTSDTISPN